MAHKWEEPSLPNVASCAVFASMAEKRQETKQQKKPRGNDWEGDARKLAGVLEPFAVRPGWVVYSTSVREGSMHAKLLSEQEPMLKALFQLHRPMQFRQSLMQRAIKMICQAKKWNLGQEDITEYCGCMAKRVRTMCRHFAKNAAKPKPMQWVQAIIAETPVAAIVVEDDSLQDERIFGSAPVQARMQAAQGPDECGRTDIDVESSDGDEEEEEEEEQQQQQNAQLQTETAAEQESEQEKKEEHAEMQKDKEKEPEGKKEPEGDVQDTSTLLQESYFYGFDYDLTNAWRSMALDATSVDTMKQYSDRIDHTGDDEPVLATWADGTQHEIHELTGSEYVGLDPDIEPTSKDGVQLQASDSHGESLTPAPCGSGPSNPRKPALYKSGKLSVRLKQDRQLLVAIIEAGKQIMQIVIHDASNLDTLQVVAIDIAKMYERGELDKKTLKDKRDQMVKELGIANNPPAKKNSCENESRAKEARSIC